ncbi:restriction endonuclease subunit S [Providencia rettgeri]
MLVPNLRFPKYKSYWTNYSLKDVSSNVSYGMNSAAKKYDGYNKYIRITDIDEITREFTPNPISSPSGYLDNKYKLKSGDILFTRTGASVGKTYLYKKRDGNLYFAGFLIRFSICKANPYFVYSQTLTTCYKRWVNIYSMRSGQPGINAEEYKDFNFYAPCIEEQNKIADFLSSVDEKIALQNRKVELLQQYKKGMMQKLFSQEIRFKDDNGCSFSKWEKTTLSCVASITMGTSPGSSHYNANQHGLPLIQGNADIKNRNSEPRVYTRQITKECHYNDILLSVRAPVGEVARSKHHACIGRGIAALKASGSNDQEFLYQLLLSIENKWDRISQGSTFESINTNDIKTLPIEIPSLLEQKKIADSLSLIDDKIILENTKLDKLKQWKQGLLQQMFV